MLGATYDCDSVDEQWRSTRRDDVVDWNVRPLLERREIRHVPHAHHAFLASELLVKNRGIEGVLPGVCIELLQPGVAGVRLTGLRDRARHDRTKDCAHRSRRDRIANQNLAAPLGVDQSIPVFRRLLRSNHVAVVTDYFRSEVGVVRIVTATATFGIDRRRPCWLVALQQSFFRRSIERLRRRAKPAVSLWIRFLRPHPFENFLRPHVDPLHVDIRMRLLELLLEVLQQLLPVRRIDDENLSFVRTTTDKQCQRNQTQAQSRRPKAASRQLVVFLLPFPEPNHLTVFPPKRFAKIRAPPATPAGSCLNNASVTSMYVPRPYRAARIPAGFGCSPGSFIASIDR